MKETEVQSYDLISTRKLENIATSPDHYEINNGCDPEPLSILFIAPLLLNLAF
ncbi:hypothetical protein PL9214430306 [Planktothrix tepida PCC 9214]|uniref:Uncharacterized protein n=1 Tax=Planktothrix tepida PCC 9214 TaxID=671072 RepID=A0A1J1LJH4_9CYAN|nr:hypothetical protein PL9214430306 [Planktothrix tepida PCC 9214]